MRTCRCSVGRSCCLRSSSRRSLRTRATTRRSRSSSGSQSRSAVCGARRSPAGSAPRRSIPPTRRRTTTSRSATSTKAISTKARAAYEKALELEPTTRSSSRTTSCSRKSMTARTARTLSSLVAVLLTRPARATTRSRSRRRSGQARRRRVPARARRRIPRRRDRRRRREPRDDAPAAQSAAHQVGAARHRCRRPAADGSRRRGARQPTVAANGAAGRSRTTRISSLRARVRGRRVLEEDRRGVSAAADRHRHRDVHAAGAQRIVSASRKSSTRSAAAARCRSAPSGTQGVRPDGRFVFIDGRTGATLLSENFSEEILYNANQPTPALSSYFELMDRLIPSFLSTLSSQKIKGTRILLQ